MKSNEDEDRWLRSALDAASGPGFRDLTQEVRRRVRRGNARRIVSVAAIVLAAGAVGWWAFPRETPTAVPRALAMTRDEPRELAALFAPPPVAHLDLLNQQQAAYMEAMQSLEKE